MERLMRFILALVAALVLSRVSHGECYCGADCRCKPEVCAQGKCPARFYNPVGDG